MRMRRLSCPQLVALLLMGCDATSPGALRPVTLRFCGEGPNWLAYHNVSDGWVSVPIANIPGVPDRTIMAGDRTILAYGASVLFADGSKRNESRIYVLFASADDIQSIQCANEYSGPRLVEGNATNVRAAPVNVSVSSPATQTAGSEHYFYWNGTRDSVDLLARDSGNWVFLQHNVDLTGASRPSYTNVVVDFNSTKAAALDSASLAFSGEPSFEAVVDYFTELGSQLSVIKASGTGTTTRVGLIPPALRGARDVHRALVWAPGKAVVHFFQGASDLTLAPGPAIAAHTVSVASADPFLLDASLPVQAEYPDFARAYFVQDTLYARPGCERSSCFDRDRRQIVVAMTASYRGSAGEWSLSIPDLTQAPGFNSSFWGFVSGRATSVCAEAWSMDRRYFFSTRAAPQQGGLTMRGAAGTLDGASCLAFGLGVKG